MGVTDTYVSNLLFIYFFTCGLLFITTFLFFYIFSRERSEIYKSIFILFLVSFVFELSETIIIFVGGVLKNPYLAREFHRIEQVVLAFYLFAFPYFIYCMSNVSGKIKTFFKGLFISGLGLAILILLIAYIFPDLYISMKEFAHRSSNKYEILSRGKEGLFITIRDILVILYSIISFIILAFSSFRDNDKFKYSKYIFIGVIISWIMAIDDIFYVYTSNHFIKIGDLQFSRLTIGLAINALFSGFSVIKYFLDKTDQVELAYRALNETEKKFNQIANNIKEVFWLIEYNKTENKYKLLYVNKAYEKLWGQPPSTIEKNFLDWLNYVHINDVYKISGYIENIVNFNDFEETYRIYMANGTVKWIYDKWVKVDFYTGNIDVYRYARVSEDITNRKKMEDKLIYLAYHDQLTGLKNRKAFKDRLEELIKVSKRKSDSYIAILFIDIDDFKDINDSLGHKIGDELLVEVTNRLKRVTRESDFIFRFGGDEFVIVLTNINEPENAGIVANKIITELSEKFIISENKIYIGCSIGISIYPDDSDDPEELIRKADTALTEAKKERNSYSYYSKAMEDKAIEKVRLLSDLKEAMKKDQLFIVYQPIVDVKGNIAGSESLIRWKHPELGLIPPSKFISIAEECMLIGDIGDYVLEKTCKEKNEIITQIDNKDIFFSVNVSIKQFKDKNFVDRILDLKEKFKFNDNQLHIEITESVFLSSFDIIVEKLKKLKENGIYIALDDFGTGYSSLNYLEKLPLNSIKIDRSFIIDIPKIKNRSPLVESIVEIANKLNLSIIVEGIENIEQLEYMSGLVKDLKVQGFYFSKPLAKNEFVEFINMNKTFSKNI